MNEDAFELLIATLINDLSISFPADLYPGVAAAITQVSAVYARELKTKKLLASLGISLPPQFPDLSFMPPLTGSYSDETKHAAR